MYLTKLNRVKAWVGYPCNISAIIGDNDGIIFTVTGYDVEGNVLSTQESIEYTESNAVINICVHTIYGSFAGVDHLLLQIKDAEVQHQIYIDVEEPCDNPVFVEGRNSMGGVMQWLFDYAQDYWHDYKNDKKAKRYSMIEANLEIDQWEALEDFITLGEVYKNTIVDVDNSVIKTSSRVGQQLYVVDTNGNRIGVVCVTNKNKTSTRRFKHTYELEIEFPELFTV